MYDPTLVETFSRIYRSIAPPETEFDSADEAQQGQTSDPNRDEGKPSQQTTLDSISSSTAETRMLYELGQAIGSRTTVVETADAISAHLRRCVPSSSFILFAYDQARDELVARHTSGDLDSMSGIRIALGERISGWVAANRRTAINSDPTLDLGDIARTRSPRLLSCLSTVIELSETLVGVITLYSTQREAFSDQHSRVVQMAAGQAAEALRFRLEAEQTPQGSEDGENSNPSNKAQLERSFDRARSHSEDSSLSVVVVMARGSTAETGLEVIADTIRPLLRSTDELFQSGPDELVAIMPRTDSRSCDLISEHIYESMASKASLSGLTLARASWPEDGDTLLALVATARNRMRQAPTWSPRAPGPDPAVH